MKNIQFNGLGLSIDPSMITFSGAFPRPGVVNPASAIVPVLPTNPTGSTVQNVVATTFPYPSSNLTSSPVLLSFTVSDNKGVLPLATVQIDNKYYATTEQGVFQLPNVSPASVVTISYIGYSPMTFSAANAPKKVILQTSTTALNEVVITVPTKPTPEPIKKPKSNTFGWLAAAALVAVVIKKGMTPEKTERVKIKKA